MRRVLLTLVAAAALAATMAACGTTSSTDTPVAPSTTEPAAAKAETAGLGDTLAIAGMETQLEVTASQDKRVKAVKLYGSEMSPAA